jgi:hypothetical protein
MRSAKRASPPSLEVGMTQRRVNSDADRARVRDFFMSTLPDPTV